MLEENHILDGYRLIRAIGRGGFGEVWLCQLEATQEFKALKFIAATDNDLLVRELNGLIRYRTVTAQLQCPHLIPIEHVNRVDAGLFYTMPVADGLSAISSLAPGWAPKTLAALIEERRGKETWFTVEEITAIILPVIEAVEKLCDAGIVHRDIKPENILFIGGRPCLGDISLLTDDAVTITRRGTPGYAAPSWYFESGGNPDMWGLATTLYSLITGNSPDKLGRGAFLWPPQGEQSVDREEWNRFHQIILRATHENATERYLRFDAFLGALILSQEDGGISALSRISAITGFKWMALAGALILAILGGTYLIKNNSLKPKVTSGSIARSNQRSAAIQESPSIPVRTGTENRGGSGVLDESQSVHFLKPIVLKNSNDKAEVKRYLLALQSTVPWDQMRSFFPSGPIAKKYFEVGAGNYDVVLDALENTPPGIGKWYLYKTLESLATVENRKLVIKALEKHPFLISKILEFHWEQDAKSVLLSRLRGFDYSDESIDKFEGWDSFISSAWIKAIVNLNDPSTYPLLEQGLIHFRQKAANFEVCAPIEGFDFARVSRQAWFNIKPLKRPTNGYTYDYFFIESCKFAPMAAKYGVKDALFVALDCYKEGSAQEKAMTPAQAQTENRAASRLILAREIASLLECEVADLGKYSANRDKLIYVPNTHHWILCDH
jgi:serine/threonine protein kinase